MSELIAKLNRRVETIAAHRKPQVLLLVMLCFATTVLSTQTGAHLIAIFLAGAVVLIAAALIVDGLEIIAGSTIDEWQYGIIFPVLYYFAARDLARAASTKIPIPAPGVVALINFIQSYAIALFIISCACAVTAFVSRQLNWTRS